MAQVPRHMEKEIQACITSISKAEKDVFFPRILIDHASDKLVKFYRGSWKPEHPKSPMKIFVKEILRLNFNESPCFINIDQFETEPEPDPIEIIQGLEEENGQKEAVIGELVQENQELNDKITEMSYEAGNTEDLVATLYSENATLKAKVDALETVLSSLTVTGM